MNHNGPYRTVHAATGFGGSIKDKSSKNQDLATMPDKSFMHGTQKMEWQAKPCEISAGTMSPELIESTCFIYSKPLNIPSSFALSKKSSKPIFAVERFASIVPI